MSTSLTVKLMAAFLAVSLIGVALVAIFSRLITEREFDRFRQEQARNDFIAQATAYYQVNNSWAGLDQALNQFPLFSPLPAQPGDPLQPPPRPRFALANRDNIVVLADGPYRLNDRVPPNLIEQGIPLEVNGQRVGTVLIDTTRPPREPLEEQYLVRTNQAVIIAAIGAAIIALGVGIFLTRTLTRSLRELTTATLAMGQGKLTQTVPVRSQDELGQLAQAFNRMSADLARANQLRRQMTADIAHDLRTPLAVISGYLEAMREGDLTPTPARLEAIYTEAQHLKHLVTDLRTLSLADAGELPLNKQPVSVPVLLERVAAAHTYQAEQQQITLAVQVKDKVPEIQADPERLVQVLGNLVSNGLRYTPAGGQIILAAQAQAGQVRLQVRDTGQGIAPAELPHIFHRFYRADKSRQQTEGESGLGLAIAKAIVEAHGGVISAESQLGQGTTFTIILPAG